MNDHIGHIERAIQILAENGLKIKLSKCEFAKESIKVLGHVVDKNGVRLDMKKADAIQNYPVPRSARDVRSFLGLASYYRRFIPKFAQTSKPLHELTSISLKSFMWNFEHQKAFENLRKKLCEPPVLMFPNFEKEFFVDTDVSDIALGAFLSQKDEDGRLHPCQFASRVLNPAEKNYSVCEREALAVVFALKKFRAYLIGRPFGLLGSSCFEHGL